ncbi:MAG TPA: class I SAM-dependent methyltransferase [Solirubrobacteraceae bacterium]|nr:class I SAM-dependent methyltransferase [Solirubrobacteraceae bacterium]
MVAALSDQDSVWEAVAEGSEPAYAALRGRFLLEHVAALSRELGAPPRVLDVGCGDGYFTAQLAQAGAVAIGADISAEALRRARSRDPQLRLQPIDAGAAWPLADASFDAVWAGEVIEHVADTAGWLSEVRRVLRPRGELLLSTPANGRLTLLALALSGRRFDRQFDPLSDHLRFYSARALRRLLGEFGFDDIDVHGAGGLVGARRVLLACARRKRW